MTTQEIRNERDMLDENINRMFVTDDYGEFEAMYSFAKSRIEIRNATLSATWNVCSIVAN